MRGQTRVKKGVLNDGIHIKGFARIQLWDHSPDGKDPHYKLAYDSGYFGPNQKTNFGLLYFINYALGGTAGSSLANCFVIGNSAATTVPASNATSLPGASWATFAAVYSSFSSTSPQWTGSTASCSAAGTIACIGMANSTNGSGSICWGISVPTIQTWATNQSLNVTYQLQLS